MKIQRILLAVLTALGAAAMASAAAVERDLYVLGVALDQRGEPGSWERVGAERAWKAVRAGAVFKDQLFTAEKNGTLQATNLSSGKRKQVGKAEFGETTFMFAGGDKLYTIETDGSLYRVDPGDGSWERVGAEGAWKAVRAGAIFKGKLYTTETDGALQATNLANGKRKPVGKADFAAATFLGVGGEKLFTIETDGDLYRVDPEDGARSRVGAEGAWKTIRAGAILKDRLYTAENDGTLQLGDLDAGERKQIGNPEFGNTTFMFRSGDQIFTIETDGSLYRVFVNPPESINAYNWCPEEIEKVFREQGKPFYADVKVRQVLGAKATHTGVIDGLAWLRENTNKKDLVVMYVGCHGFTDPKEGWGVETADRQTLWGRELKEELAKLPCQVLLMIETCASGGFAQAHQHDPAVPANVTVLCACSAKQETDNQLDIAVAEALYGRADFNKDGVVDLDELIRYVDLRYKEYHSGPNKIDGGDTPVIHKAQDASASLPLTRPSAEVAAVVHNGGYWSALLEKQDGDKFQVHLLGWSSKPGPYFQTNHVPRDCICLPTEGAPLLVEQNGQWFAARLLSKDGEKYKVHYLGYNEDEVVTKERVKYPFVGQPEETKPPTEKKPAQ